MELTKTNSAQAYKKLFICDIHSSLENSEDSSKILEELKKVCIFGIIIGIKRFQKLVVFEVDDGTGTFSCSLWNEDEHKKMEIINLKDRLLAESVENVPMKTDLENIINKISKPDEEEESDIILGNLILIMGQLKFFRGKPQVAVHHHNILHDPNMETQMMLERLLLYRHVY